MVIPGLKPPAICSVTHAPLPLLTEMLSVGKAAEIVAGRPAVLETCAGALDDVIGAKVTFWAIC
jgi:hypothetical protein